MPFSSDQMELLRLIMRVFCSMSVFFNLSLIACVVALKRFHKPMSFLQANLAGFEIIHASMYIIGSEIAKTSPTACFYLGIACQLFANAVSFMSVIISLYVYLSIIYRRGVAERYWYYYHGYVYGMSAILTGLLFVMQAILGRGPVIGEATLECWISEEYPDLRVYLFYLPLWINSAFIFAIYARILLFLRSHRKTKNDENIRTGVIPAAPATDVTSHPEKISQSNQENTSSRIFPISASGSNAPSLSRKTMVASSPPAPTILTIPSIPRSHKTGKSAVSRGNKLLLIMAGVTAIGFIISWMPVSSRRLLNLFTASDAPYWWIVLSAVGLSTLGFWNAGIFFLTWLWPSFSKNYGTRASDTNEGVIDYPTNASGGKNCGV
ncbi:hypothetical protein CcCBS67573_g08377 [Chytriomyces confervae]|uniref:G-protein coupled receptors family 2 profile 2 domain-containing protein n=1 Tax=Chytriomyces confervae TaxID=246404 RepID=A0A507EMN3_9FUNG|nr:hypothetical protein CcCBS67573_g08377 [Chytriomyces confervae]